MHPEFRTERLILNLISLADAEAILQLRSDDLVNRYINREPMATMDASRAFIEKTLANISKEDCYYWAVRLDKGPRLIGTTCLFHLDAEAGTAELGYELMPEFQGQGIMREAVACMIRFAREEIQLRRLDAWIHGHNEASMKLAAHFGFRRDPELEALHRDLPELKTMQIHTLDLNTYR